VITIRFARAYLKAGISVGEQSQDFERKNTTSQSKRIASQRIQEFESRRLEISRVRGFELDSGVIPTVKSEANKESEN
jgi:hypothetical protein